MRPFVEPLGRHLVEWLAGLRALFALAAAIAISRVYLGVHYPSDVLVGALLGGAIGALAVVVLRAAERALASWRRPPGS
jgi:membrane-associated phospholipid phosphatase